MVVNSEKALERKLKRPGNQIGGGERGERGGTMGRVHSLALSKLLPGRWEVGRQKGKERR